MRTQADETAEPSAITAGPAAGIAKALAHPARVRIIALLLSRPGCIGGEIVDEIGLAQSTVSEHLRILKASGIVRGRIEYPRICYSLDPDAIAPLRDLLEAIAAHPPETRVCYTPRRTDPG
jgi:ArsR family transcriptional regulator